MRRWVILYIALTVLSVIFAEDVITSIYDIQYTTNPGFDGTYPSLYLGQNVTVEGVVIGINFEGNRVYISERRGGPWSGIAIEPIRNHISNGDFIQVTGKVSEIMGMTVINHVSNVAILSRNQILPQPVSISVHEALTSEAYESVLVRLSNITCNKLLNGNLIALVSDDTANINIGNGFNKNINNSLFHVGNTYTQIIGIINFSHNRFTVHPRNDNDIIPQTTGIESSSWGRIKSMYR